MNIDSPFEQWRLKYMKGTAASREIMELLALAFEGGRVAEREACAKSCEEWGMKKVNDWAHDEEMCEDAKARAWDAMQCAAEIRARGEK